MLNFLFWNLNRKPLYRQLANLINVHKVDVLMVCECLDEPKVAVEQLSHNGVKNFREICSSEFVAKDKVYLTTFVNFECTVSPFPSKRWHLMAIDRPNHAQFLLGVAHLPSKLERHEDIDRVNVAYNLSSDIEIKERDHGHTRFVLAGDLNSNYFDKDIVSHHGLHAICPSVATVKNERQVDQKSKKFFCNPCWIPNLRMKESHHGTYYYNASGKSLNYFWHSYDQVLYRPSMAEFFKGYCIITTDNENQLIDRHGRPNKSDYSDHLPLHFQFDF